MNTLDLAPTRRAAVAGLLVFPLATAAADTAVPGDAELLKVREKVWRDWFSGNRAALLAILPEDFRGTGTGGGPARSRGETMEESEGFVKAGNKLTVLEFTNNQFQRLGAVTVIYCGFSFTFSNTAGASTVVSGRATEIFMRSGNKWLHPGWHLDSGK